MSSEERGPRRSGKAGQGRSGAGGGARRRPPIGRAGRPHPGRQGIGQRMRGERMGGERTGGERMGGERTDGERMGGERTDGERLGRGPLPTAPDGVDATGHQVQRRSLSHQGGAAELVGEPEIAARLAKAMAAPEGVDEDRLTHGFHTYPARMHAAIARQCLQDFHPGVGAHVLDPFCGSGTVLLEARLQGLHAHGCDLNPLALRVAQVHCSPLQGPLRTQFEEAVRLVATNSEARVRQRVPIRARLPRAEVARYQPHVLLELAGLYAEIGGIQEVPVRRVLEVVFSAMVVKFSRQRADTSDQLVEKRLRKGLVTEFFVRKTHELLRRWQAVDQEMPQAPGRLHLVQGDARRLPKTLGTKAPAMDLVLTSPPYGGTYDYVQHHARRYPWLGLSPERFAEWEIGSRRALSADPQGAARWDEELGAALGAIGRCCRPGAQVVVLLGDAQVGGVRVDALVQLRRIAPQANMDLVAGVAQRRPDFRGGPSRREHLICLTVREKPAKRDRPYSGGPAGTH